MKTAALISGGKDSCFNMMCCIAEGHDIVALANLRPRNKEELDSYMYQTVGNSAIELYSEAIGLPLFTCYIDGTSVSRGSAYEPVDDDEVEDMHKLLKQIKDEMEIEAVSVGAIFSDYQRVRVEHVCDRLGLKVLAYLWRCDQEVLLQEMIDCGIKAKIIKVAAMGLTPQEHLMMDLDEILPHMLLMKAEYGLNVCGEGGEYETFVYDCPLFQKRISIMETVTVIHSEDAFAPVGYISFKNCVLEDKDWDESIPLREKVLQLPIMTTDKWVYENVSVHSGGSDQSRDDEAPAGGLVMCVPELKITGEEEVRVRTGGKDFQVAGIIAPTSDSKDVKDACQTALTTLMDCLNDQGLRPSDICSMSLYIGNMADFAAINEVYKTFFKSNPPVRLCIQANLPRNIVLQLDCQGRVRQGGKENERKIMHVQSLSHWAPANIGPYSQAIWAGDKIFLAGIVPLVPSTLNVVDGGISAQCSVAIMHIEKILKAMLASCTLKQCPLVVCYVTSQDYISTALQEWNKAVECSEESESEKSSITPLVQCCVVPALPKGCKVEWHTFAWPSLLDLTDVREISQNRDHNNYTIKSRIIYSTSKLELFSCHMVVELTGAEIYRRLKPPAIVTDLLEEYTNICEQCGIKEEIPLVRVLFSPVIFNYLQINQAFSEVLSKIRCEFPPVVSLVSVNGLQSRQQILAWVQ